MQKLAMFRVSHKTEISGQRILRKTEEK